MQKKTTKVNASTAQFLASLKQDDADLTLPRLISIDDLEPDPENVRTEFRPIDGQIPKAVLDELREFADNIHANTLLHPIVAIEMPNGKFRIMIGERRWRAFNLNRELGREHYDKIPTTVRYDIDESVASSTRFGLAQISENIQRSNVSDLDVAKKLKRILESDPDLQKQDIAQAINKPASYVSRIMAMLDPRWAPLVDRGLITYSSILEHLKSLPEAAREQVIAKATTEKRPINSTDVQTARKEGKAAKEQKAANPATSPEKAVPADVRAGTLDMLAAHAVPGESYDPSHAAQSRAKADKAIIEDHGGDPVIPTGAIEFALSHASKISLRLTLAQLQVLLKAEAITEDGMATVVSLDLPLNVAQDALELIGGDMPKSEGQLGGALLAKINSYL